MHEKRASKILESHWRTEGQTRTTPLSWPVLDAEVVHSAVDDERADREDFDNRSKPMNISRQPSAEDPHKGRKEYADPQYPACEREPFCEFLSHLWPQFQFKREDRAPTVIPRLSLNCEIANTAVKVTDGR